MASNGHREATQRLKVRVETKTEDRDGRLRWETVTNVLVSGRVLCAETKTDWTTATAQSVLYWQHGLLPVPKIHLVHWYFPFRCLSFGTNRQPICFPKEKHYVLVLLLRAVTSFNCGHRGRHLWTCRRAAQNYEIIVSLHWHLGVGVERKDDET